MMTINQQINLEFLDQGTPHPISKHMETVLDQLLTRLNCAVLKPQQKLNNQEEKKKKKILATASSAPYFGGHQKGKLVKGDKVICQAVCKWLRHTVPIPPYMHRQNLAF